MPEPTAPAKKLQWKWVLISFVSYILFYVLPLVLAGQINARPGLHDLAGFLIAIWAFAGIIIIAAVVSYNSEGVTLWEPAIAALIVVVLMFIYVAIVVFSSLLPQHRMSVFSVVVPALVWTAVAFALSLFGAWFGERAQKLWKKKTPEKS